MGLCLWTALHLNIPQHGKSSVQRWRKLRWLIMGLLAPELVAYTAWYQRRAASRLTGIMKIILKIKPSAVNHRTVMARFMARLVFKDRKSNDHDIEMSAPRNIKHRHPWTMTHSFYASMGGFAFDTDEAKPQFLPNGRTRLAISSKGLIYIAEREPDLIPDLSRDFIRDKSKADGLAKLLVCLQALWFCVQCILRIAQGYGVGLLELNIFGHAICALLIYTLWWEKPLDIEEPTLLSGEKTWELCALMCMSSCVAQTFSLGGFLKRWKNGLFDMPATCCELLTGSRFGDIWSKPWCLPDADPSRRLKYGDIAFMFFEWSPDSERTKGSAVKLVPSIIGSDDSNGQPINIPLPGNIEKGQLIFGFRCTGPWGPSSLDFGRPLQELRQITTQQPGLKTSCWLDLTDSRRFELCSKALQQYHPAVSRSDLYDWRYPCVNTISDRVGDERSSPAVESLYLARRKKSRRDFSCWDCSRRILVRWIPSPGLERAICVHG